MGTTLRWFETVLKENKEIKQTTKIENTGFSREAQEREVSPFIMVTPILVSIN